MHDSKGAAMVTFFLVVVALLAVLWGLLTLTQATQGVGAIAIACFLVILARLAQAGDHHRAIRDVLTSRWAAIGGQPGPAWSCTRCGTQATDEMSYCSKCGA